MSTGETPPSATARFTSPSSTISNTSNKKYPGTPKSPMLNTNPIGNRNSQTRQRLLASKISAPRPMNLPSLRREHAVGTEVPAASPSTSHGWGSSTSSPSLPQTTEINKPAEPAITSSPVIKPEEPLVESTKVDPASSPPLNTSQASTVRAWAVPTVSKPSTQPPTTDFPTAAEAAAKKTALLYDDKEYLKYAASDPNHTSWDEMVSEDLDDFQVDVVEFDDGTKVQVDGNEDKINAVSPSDRFTEDYDRSYPPRHHNEQSDHGYHKPTYRRSEDHGYNSRYNNGNNSSNSNYDNRRHSNVAPSAPSNEERRTSNTTTDRWTRRESFDTTRLNTNRRSSYDRKSAGPSHPPVYNNPPASSSVYHPTLLQRPRRLSEQSFRSDHSREDHVNPLQIIAEPNAQQPDEIAAEITAAQREVMLTAAERAKKRRDEEEAEFEAARIRARQKADALARLAEAKKAPEVKKESESKMEPESKPESKKELDVKKEVLKKDAVKKEEEKKSSKVKSPTPPQPSSVQDKNETKTSVSSSSSSTTSAQKPIETAPLPDTSKPWNLVAAKKEIVIAKRPTTKSDTKETTKEPESLTTKKEEEIVVPSVDKNDKPLSKDEQNWEVFVSKVKTDAPIPKADAVLSDWNSYAVRLQKSVADNRASLDAKHKANNADKIVEVVDYTQNEEWGTIPSHITQGRAHDRGWTRNDEEHGGNGRNSYYNSHRGHGMTSTVADRGGRGGRGTGRGRGGITGRHSTSSSTHYNKFDTPNSNDYWRQPDTDEQKQPVVTEILKHEPIAEKFDKQETPESSDTTVVISKKTRLSNLLKESKSPIFPNFIEKLAGKKPANMSFMVDTDESDKDITMMDQVIITETRSIEESVTEERNTTDESEDTCISVPDVDKNHVPETMDETSTTSSTTSTPPRTQFDHTKNDSSRKMNVNPNYPVLVYRYPISQQTQNTEDARFEGVQQRPTGVYLMPQQQYVTGNQYMVSYPQVGTGVQPVYYPTLSWQQQEQHHFNNNPTSSPPRPHYEQRRPYNNNFKSAHNPTEWESHNGYQSHRFNNNTSTYQRGNSYRKRGWSNTTNPRGRGNHAAQPRRYPDSPSLPLTPSVDNL